MKRFRKLRAPFTSKKMFDCGLFHLRIQVVGGTGNRLGVVGDGILWDDADMTYAMNLWLPQENSQLHNRIRSQRLAEVESVESFGFVGSLESVESVR